MNPAGRTREKVLDGKASGEAFLWTRENIKWKPPLFMLWFGEEIGLFESDMRSGILQSLRERDISSMFVIEKESTGMVYDFVAV